MAEIANYPSNSDKAKTEGAIVRNEAPTRIVPADYAEEAPEKVNWFREFISGDPREAKIMVIRDVIYPSIKRMLIDSGQAFLTFLLDNGTRSIKSGNRDYYNSIKPSSGYSRGSSFSPKDQQAEPVSSIFVEHGFSTRGPAELARDNLLNIIDMQGYATVRDYYDAFGKSSRNVSYDNHYGWTNLNMTEVKYRIFDGQYYICNLPKPRLLDID